MSPKHKGREEHAGAAFAWKVFCKIFNPSLHREVVRQLEGLLSLNCVVVRRTAEQCVNQLQSTERSRSWQTPIVMAMFHS